MNRNEQRDLALLRRYHRYGDLRARDELVERALPLVRSLARPYSGKGEPFDDLVQVGCVGLIKAIDRFDASTGHRFVSFAAPNITGEIKRHFRDHSWSIHVPRSIQELDAKVERATARMQARTGREPTVAQLAAELEESPERIEEALRGGQGYRAMSLDRPVGEDGDAMDLTGAVDPEFVRAEHRHLIRECCGDLDARDRKIVRMRFVEDRLQREIAAEVGVSQMQVSRLLRRALTRMRDRAENGDVAGMPATHDADAEAVAA
ncbi:SigB/SigF/SigG family RNA polymerase sigma factor [Patulibacter sp. SYSU D01012]|uniref:SigB/SigF/SigG family RNA polymerase sigma factor n=1 Tax=Patulibacter sp. SYSU D01012 TaxID=2817381 RepID=UPI001B303CED|nr:SigB/SigF/SigG family RNA polymerase sigma factor [Patulibacter sp. SYSU D01012]